MMKHEPANSIADVAARHETTTLTSRSHDIDIEKEMTHWRETHATMRYASTRYLLPEFEPAYRYGLDAFARETNKSRSFVSAADELSGGWDAIKGESRLAWRHAKHAAEAAWRRVQFAMYNDDTTLEGSGERAC